MFWFTLQFNNIQIRDTTSWPTPRGESTCKNRFISARRSSSTHLTRLLITSGDLINRSFWPAHRGGLGNEAWDGVVLWLLCLLSLYFYHARLQGRLLSRSEGMTGALCVGALVNTKMKFNGSTIHLKQTFLSWAKTLIARWRILVLEWRRFWAGLRFLQLFSGGILDRCWVPNSKNLWSSSASVHVQPTAKDCGRSHLVTNGKAQYSRWRCTVWRIRYCARKGNCVVEDPSKGIVFPWILSKAINECTPAPAWTYPWYHSPSNVPGSLTKT